MYQNLGVHSLKIHQLVINKIMNTQLAFVKHTALYTGFVIYLTFLIQFSKLVTTRFKQQIIKLLKGYCRHYWTVSANLTLFILIRK